MALARPPPAEVLEDFSQTGPEIFDDPEAIFQGGWFFCDVGEYERGMTALERASREVTSRRPRSRRSQFDPIRSTSAFQSLLADAEAGRQRALAAFRQAGGARLLGCLEAWSSTFDLVHLVPAVIDQIVIPLHQRLELLHLGDCPSP